LVEETRDTYCKLTDSANPEAISEWKWKAAKAQVERHNDVTAMDYFALKIGEGMYP